MREALADPHVKASGFFVESEFPGIGRAPVVAPPVTLHATPGEVRHRAPMLGEHNEEVLRELGYSNDAIEALIAGGTV